MIDIVKGNVFMHAAFQGNKNSKGGNICLNLKTFDFRNFALMSHVHGIATTSAKQHVFVVCDLDLKAISIQ